MGSSSRSGVLDPFPGYLTQSEGDALFLTPAEAASTYLPVSKIFSGAAIADGVHDDTAALQAFLNTLAAGDFAVIPQPAIAYKISSTLTMPTGMIGPDPGVLTILWCNVRLESTVTNAPVIQYHTGTHHMGRVMIDCNDATGSIGAQIGGAVSTYNITIDRLEIFNADSYGFLATSTAGHGNYYHHIGYLACRYGDSHGAVFESQGATNETNSITIGDASIQNNTGDAFRVDGADGITFLHGEAESNGGYGINLIDAVGFFFLGGWLEGNTAGEVKLADYPAVSGVIKILAQMDGTLGSAVTQTASGSRSVTIGRGNGDLRDFGYRGFSYLSVGLDGAAGTDQDVAVNRMAVSSGFAAHRKSAADPTFTIAGASAGMRFVITDGTDVLMDTSSGGGMRVPGTLKSITGGLDLQPLSGGQSIRAVISGAGQFQLLGGAGLRHAGNAVDLDGTGSPEGVVTAVVGSTYRRRDGGAGTSFYVKESGTGNTGWVAK